MPDLTPFDANLEADVAMVLQDSLGPGMDVVLLDPDGEQHPLRAIYEAPGAVVNPGKSYAPVVSTAHMIHFRESVVQHALGRPLSRRDRFIVRGKTYAVQNPQTNGFGFASVKLLEAADA
ncbi:MAG: hypothetical protein LBQ51_05690 [Desulfovibrio sp.]|jgi:hypothetical protein|nr:hypothetical protein [Desulfovibrio sp.]